MRKFLALTALLTLSAPALADTYQVVAGFSDPTTYQPDETPSYIVKYRVNNGAETVLASSPTTGRSFSLTANPGEPIDVAAQTCNDALCGGYTPWVTAAAGYPPTTPQVPTGLTITVTRTGP